MSGEAVKLFVVQWTDHRPSVASIDATRNAAGEYHIPKGAPHCFGLLTPIDEAARERLCIGLDPVDAVYRAFEKAKVAETRTEKSLRHIQRSVTELAVLGMAEANFSPTATGRDSGKL